MSQRLSIPQEASDHLRRWYDDQLLHTARVLRGSFFGWLFGKFGQHAVTINKTVHLTPHAPGLDTPSGVSLLGHEFYHVLQQAELGWWRFLLKYVIRWRPPHIKQGWLHPMEEPAYARGREVLEGMGQ